MIKLNLSTSNKQQEMIKQYLEENASEILADKINNGVKIVKDNKNLTSKKDLDGFWRYATDEARKISDKSANGAYVDDETVYGWAIHYFEEDSIEGKLFNEDGTEYKPVVKTTPKTTKPTPTIEVKQKPKNDSGQATLFDFFDSQMSENKKVEEDTDEIENEPTNDKIEPIIEEKQPQIPSFYEIYDDRQKCYPDIIVLTRLGDFYEAFGDTAKIVADELELTLTSRDVGLPEKVALAGFPVHVFDSYTQKLLKKHTLYIIEDDKERFIEQTKDEPLPIECPAIDNNEQNLILIFEDKLLINKE